MKRIFLLLVFSASVLSSNAQKVKKEDRQLLENLKHHVQFLADDKLEGRRTGTAGEKLAAEYIAGEFGKIGLKPKGSNGFFQEFTINEGRRIDEKTFLSIDGHELKLNKDFFLLNYSSNISLEAMPSLSLEESGMPWFLDLKEMIEANAANPHYDLASALASKAKEIKGKGASAIFVYNTSGTADGLKFDSKDRSPSIGIPVIYINKEAAAKYFHDISAALDIKLVSSISEISRTGRNVVGFVDNGAAHTIVLGAHYDHLGLGEDGNSREVGFAAEINKFIMVRMIMPVVHLP